MNEVADSGSGRPLPPVALVVMSQDPHLLPVYLKVIRPVLGNYGYHCVATRDLLKPGVVTEQVQEIVDAADVVVCDLSYADHQVYYHLGIADALQKRTILLTQEGGTFLFSLKYHRAIVYKDDQFKLVDLKDGLIRVLKELKEPQASARHRSATGIPATGDELDTARAELYSENIDSQRYSVHFLRDYRDKDSYARIRSLITSDHTDLVRDAFVALHTIDPDMTLAELLSFRGIGNREQIFVREAAVGLLAHYAPEAELIARVQELLKDTSWGVRAAACQVLGKWRAAEALSLLKDRLADSHAPVRVAAEEAIARIESKVPSKA
jgi:hypothetical protein